jgi:hypothetical protein
MKVEVTLAAEFCEIRDQGQRPTCVAFAASDLHAFSRSEQTKLSVEYGYYHAVQRCTPPDPHSGVTLQAISHALGHDGQPAEEGWPYLAVLPADLRLWKPPGTVGVVYRQKWIGRPLPVDAAGLIRKRIPALLGLMLTPSFFRPDKDGIVQENTSEMVVGTHAVVAIGIGQSHGKQYFLIRNSWGRSWGAEGTAWISEEYLQRRLMAVLLMEKP